MAMAEREKGVSFKVTKDTLSPGLAKVARNCGNPKAVLQDMGDELVSMTVQAFTNSSFRAMPWPPVKKAGGQPLYASGALKHSIRITALTNNFVMVGTDRLYASYHQFGTRPYDIIAKAKKARFWPGARHPVKKVHHPGLPARPFFPFNESGEMIPAAKQRIEATAKAALTKLMQP